MAPGIAESRMVIHSLVKAQQIENAQVPSPPRLARGPPYQQDEYTLRLVSGFDQAKSFLYIMDAG